MEVIIALGLLCGASLGGGLLLVTAVRANGDARAQTMTAVLASARMEELRGLAFEFDSDGNRVTNAALSSAGTDSLASSTPGFVDHLDARGLVVGTGPAPPPDAVFVRRWSIDPVPATADVLIIQVLVRPIAGSAPGHARRARAESRLVTALARVER